MLNLPLLAGGGSLDLDTQAWIRAVGPANVSYRQGRRVDTLNRTLKASSVYYALDRLWLFAAENATQALIDVKARATATAVSSPVFTAGRGYKGSHSASTINSGFNASTAGGNYVQNSASFGVWIETVDTTPTSTMRMMGNDESNYGFISTAAVNLTYGINNGAQSNTTIPNASTGLFSVNRSAASGAGAVAAYLNGVQDSTGTISSVTVANRNFFILASNNGGAVYQPTDARLSCAYIGGSLSAAQNAALYAALRAYMTAQGVA